MRSEKHGSAQAPESLIGKARDFADEKEAFPDDRVLGCLRVKMVDQNHIYGSLRALINLDPENIQMDLLCQGTSFKILQIREYEKQRNCM